MTCKNTWFINFISGYICWYQFDFHLFNEFFGFCCGFVARNLFFSCNNLGCLGIPSWIPINLQFKLNQLCRSEERCPVETLYPPLLELLIRITCIYSRKLPCTKLPYYLQNVFSNSSHLSPHSLSPSILDPSHPTTPYSIPTQCHLHPLQSICNMHYITQQGRLMCFPDIPPITKPQWIFEL